VLDLMAAVEVLLRQSPGDAVCAACLAFACEVSLTEMRDVIVTVVASDDRSIEIAPTCVSCRRTVPSAIYRPRVGKCAHCSQPIARHDVSEFIGGDLFHAPCWRRLMTDKAIRVSRSLGHRSREMIEASRRRIHEGHGGSRSISPPDLPA
jgi:hypothetical protein